MLLLGFGLFPLWVALAFIAYAFAFLPSHQAGYSLYALMAAIPSCGVTMAIALVGRSVHRRTTGDPQRKLRFSAAAVGIPSLALVVIGVTYALEKQRTEQILRHEKGRVERFVQDRVEVQGMAGVLPKASVASYSIKRGDTLPAWYDVSVAGGRAAYAIVDVDRSTTPSTFRLRCVTPLSVGQRQSGTDPCQQ